MTSDERLHPLVSFQVRLRDQESLEQMGRRIASALGVEFVPSDSHMFRETRALEAASLGFWITLSYWPPSQDGEQRTYQVAGESAEDVRNPWSERVDISSFMAEVLCRRDAREWYVPSVDELLRDVMAD